MLCLEIVQEMAVCSKEYLENRCAPGTRVPAMEKACLAWEKCMNRDPTVVGRAKVSAETFAEIINSFIEPISYKTMVFSPFLSCLLSCLPSPHFLINVCILMLDILSPGSLRLSIPIKLRVRPPPSPRSSSSSIHALSTNPSCTPSNTSTNA